MKVTQSCLTQNSSGQNTGVGRLSLLQGIFPTQVSCIAGRFFISWVIKWELEIIYKNDLAYVMQYLCRISLLHWACDKLHWVLEQRQNVSASNFFLIFFFKLKKGDPSLLLGPHRDEKQGCGAVHHQFTVIWWTESWSQLSLWALPHLMEACPDGTAD